MKRGILLSGLLVLIFVRCASVAGAPFQFEVSVKRDLVPMAQLGRLFVLLSPTNDPEPRLVLGRTGPEAPWALARDVTGLSPKTRFGLDEHSFSFPLTNITGIPAGEYFVQAVLESNADLRSPNAPGNLYSSLRKLVVNPNHHAAIKLELDHQIPPEQLPADTESVKFIRLQSRLLSEFHHRPIFLRAGVLLPRDYERETSRRYPLWVNIGGLNTRYTRPKGLMSQNSAFRKTWLGDDTPRFIMIQLDGAGPLGDPYQVNSDNNGPYGDALVQELIPHIETKFRAVAQAQARVLSGVSTGGWVSLALQVFYPDFFNGTWASCPDPVDFRALELINIYEDDSAYINKHGNERPSARDLNGDVSLTMRREVEIENLLGAGNSYTLSGEQWGAWNAVFGPRGANGLPVPLWDPQTGKIDHTVARMWRKYDLRLVLEENWAALGPKLRGKLHIAAGEADDYFLNNAVHLLDDFLSQAKPRADAKIFYGPGKGHGWSNLSLREMMREMESAVEPLNR